MEGIYRQISAQLHPRPYGEVAKFFTGLELIDPVWFPSGSGGRSGTTRTRARSTYPTAGGRAQA
ncbi:hypothetical protein GCM10018954_072680 [Kutzneria kofuensis]